MKLLQQIKDAVESGQTIDEIAVELGLPYYVISALAQV